MKGFELVVHLTEDLDGPLPAVIIPGRKNLVLEERIGDMGELIVEYVQYVEPNTYNERERLVVKALTTIFAANQWRYTELRPSKLEMAVVPK